MAKSSAIDRMLKNIPYLKDRRFGLPYIGKRIDGENFNPNVQSIANAIDFYGYEVRDDNITTIPDTDLGSGNPVKYPAFPLAIKKATQALLSDTIYSYPYTEGDDNIRKILLDYVESEGFINTQPYSFADVDKNGLSVHNITFLPSTSIAFNMIINIISKPGDIILTTAPNYGLFTIRIERSGAEVEVINLEKEDDFLVNPQKLAAKIDDLNDSLYKVYHRRKGYVPRVVAFVNTNPHNPTGKVMGEKDVELLKQIGEVCLERGCFVIDDLVYRDISYYENNIAKPLSTIPGMFRNTISLFGLSKSYNMAKLRAGFVVADEIIIRELVNRIFQSMDSAPDVVGWALAGAFNTTEERKIAYNDYFTELRKLYIYKFNLLKAMVTGIDTVNDEFKTKIQLEVNKILNEKDSTEVLKGLPYVTFPHNLEPESGFFAILDFTKLSGMKYKGKPINTEKDLLQFFYNTSRTRFLVGQSISWPYKNELVGRISFSLDNAKLINAFNNMRKAINLLEPKSDFIIRKNELKDQEQMARIKVEGWKNAYDRIIASSYLNSLTVEQQTKRYINSFDEYKDLVFIAVKNEEVLGYSCFNPEKILEFDSELVSLYIKPSYIGKGIGTALFNETCKELVSLGKNNMILWCLCENNKAIEFYKKLGGKIIKTKKVKIGNNFYEEYCFYFNLKKF